jgi:hypothetical protein
LSKRDLGEGSLGGKLRELFRGEIALGADGYYDGMVSG